jgi:hypothetical protein
MEILSLHARGHRGLQLSLPEGTTFEHDGVVATPLGPRDHAWLVRAAKEPGAGADVFPWWDEGQGAAVLRNAALASMWIDVRWRRPANEDETRTLRGVVELLSRAHALEPDASPWREWSEILAHLGERSLHATSVHLRAERDRGRPEIGYRRRHVRVALSGGWSLRVPGDLGDTWDERGTWCGTDGVRSVFFTSFEARGSASSRATLEGLPPLDGEGEILATERGELHARLRFDRDEGARSAQAIAALGSHAAVGTIVFEREADREWALETWASLAHLEEPRS